ncbi:cysteine hydrolase family protein [Streptomyces sp. NBC_01190]|uniref:cysteine hydrolase family protein n=1 Tax=Streptomyces sp. NBC_01190 TaxID=2903767 RepID=UPI00386613CD|nr:cysteine hydrolase [Streptomyces sp. NBC_01190]
MALTTIDPMSALVVIDLQKGIVRPREDAPADPVVQRAAELATAFRRRGLPVVLVNVTGRAPGRTDGGSGRSGGNGAGGPGGGNGAGGAGITAFPPGWADLVDELDVRPTDHLITKRRRNAFHDTGLDTLLRDLGVTQVVLAGLSTSSGVESTARAAYDYGYHVVLATDAMSDSDPDAHRNSVERIFPKTGECATTAEITAMVERTDTVEAAR